MIAILDDVLTVKEVLPGVDVRPEEGLGALCWDVTDLQYCLSSVQCPFIRCSRRVVHQDVCNAPSQCFSGTHTTGTRTTQRHCKQGLQRLKPWLSMAESRNGEKEGLQLARCGCIVEDLTRFTGNGLFAYTSERRLWCAWALLPPGDRRRRPNPNTLRLRRDTVSMSLESEVYSTSSFKRDVPA